MLALLLLPHTLLHPFTMRFAFVETDTEADTVVDVFGILLAVVLEAVGRLRTTTLLPPFARALITHSFCFTISFKLLFELFNPLGIVLNLLFKLAQFTFRDAQRSKLCSCWVSQTLDCCCISCEKHFFIIFSYDFFLFRLLCTFIFNFSTFLWFIFVAEINFPVLFPFILIYLAKPLRLFV